MTTARKNLTGVTTSPAALYLLLSPISLLSVHRYIFVYTFPCVITLTPRCSKL